MARTKRKIRASSKDYRLNYRYGISTAQYQDMVEAQCGKCAICGEPCASLVVDHNHQTGYVRPLLCTPCNTGLGFFKDSPVLLRRAATYLIDSEIFKSIEYICPKSLESNEVILFELPEDKPKVKDWRKVRPTLSDKQLSDIANLTPDQMRTYALETDYTYKTISNWRLRARQELGIDTESN